MHFLYLNEMNCWPNGLYLPSKQSHYCGSRLKAGTAERLYGSCAIFSRTQQFNAVASLHIMVDFLKFVAFNSLPWGLQAYAFSMSVHNLHHPGIRSAMRYATPSVYLDLRQPLVERSQEDCRCGGELPSHR